MVQSRRPLGPSLGFAPQVVVVFYHPSPRDLQLLQPYGSRQDQYIRPANQRPKVGAPRPQDPKRTKRDSEVGSNAQGGGSKPSQSSRSSLQENGPKNPRLSNKKRNSGLSPNSLPSAGPASASSTPMQRGSSPFTLNPDAAVFRPASPSSSVAKISEFASAQSLHALASSGSPTQAHADFTALEKSFAETCPQMFPGYHAYAMPYGVTFKASAEELAKMIKRAPFLSSFLR